LSKLSEEEVRQGERAAENQNLRLMLAAYFVETTELMGVFDAVLEETSADNDPRLEKLRRLRDMHRLFLEEPTAPQIGEFFRELAEAGVAVTAEAD
jgi:hypothetical protein